MFDSFSSGRGSGGGRGMGGGRGLGRGGGRGRNGGFGGGPSGECICVECGYKIPHQQGISCNQQVCPKCGNPMTRYIAEQSFRKESSNVSPSAKSGKKAYITPNLCKGCRVCMPSCPEKAMEFKDGKVYILEAKCTGCGRCISTCPFEAIKLTG